MCSSLQNRAFKLQDREKGSPSLRGLQPNVPAEAKGCVITCTVRDLLRPPVCPSCYIHEHHHITFSSSWIPSWSLKLHNFPLFTVHSHCSCLPSSTSLWYMIPLHLGQSSPAFSQPILPSDLTVKLSQVQSQTKESLHCSGKPPPLF